MRDLDANEHPDRSCHAGNYGVATASDSTFYHELKLLLKSLRRHHSIPTAVFDLGMEEWQLTELSEERPETTVIKPDLPARYRSWPVWQTYCKPWYIEQAPFDSVLWLDADCLVTGPLHELFALLSHVPVLIADRFSPSLCFNPDSLYAVAPVKRRSEVPLNAGVVALTKRRDGELLRAWRAACERDGVARQYSFYDQGALLWAVESLDLSHLIIPSDKWNVPARRLHCTGHELGVVEADHPGASIIHYAGPIPGGSVPLKFSHLGVVNSDAAMAARDSGPHRPGCTRIFGLGLERAGTHTTASMIRSACGHLAWVEHEYSPSLSREARDADHGGAWPGRLELYKRRDATVVCEVNHRLIYFWKELNKEFPDCKFVATVRDPAALLASRLRAGICWPDDLHSYPIFYQQFIRDGGYHLTEQSGNRVNAPDVGPIDKHLWEIEVCCDELLACKNEVGDRLLVLDINQMTANDLIEFVDDPHVGPGLPGVAREGSSAGMPKYVCDWVDGVVADVARSARLRLSGKMSELCGKPIVHERYP